MDAPERPPIPLGLLARRGAVAIVLAVACNGLLLGAVTRFELVEPFGALTAPPVVFLTVLTTIAATAVYGAVTRLWPWPDRLFIRLAAVVLLASFLPDLGILRADPDATVGAVLVLMSMHVVVAVICIYLLTDRYSPIPRRPAAGER